MEELKCSNCKESKGLVMFAKNKTKKRGYSFWCKSCTKIAKREKALLGIEYKPKHRIIEFDNGTRLCNTCNEVKVIDDFKIPNKDKKFIFCNDCRRKKAKTKFYGISVDLYEKLIKEQNNLCKICKGTNNGKELVIDHCHNTGKVRGLLCHYCNIGLGMLKDNILILEESIRYLKNNN